jgi:hypothetical protein
VHRFTAMIYIFYNSRISIVFFPYFAKLTDSRSKFHLLYFDKSFYFSFSIFRYPKCTETLLQQCRVQKIFRCGTPGIPRFMGGERRRSGGGVAVARFLSTKNRRADQCQMLNCIVTASLLKSSLQRMLLFKHLISTHVPNKDRTISAMHRSLVTLCGAHAT